MHSRLEPFRVPDRVFLTLAILLIIGGSVFATLVYPQLPERIPTHFGFNGTPDAYTKTTVGSFFLPIIIQVALSALLLLVYRFPQYANIPTSVLAVTLHPEMRAVVYDFIRHMLAVLLVLLNALMLYLTIGTAGVALGTMDGLDERLFIVFLVLILVVSFGYTIAGTFLAKRWVRAHPSPHSGS